MTHQLEHCGAELTVVLPSEQQNNAKTATECGSISTQKASVPCSLLGRLAQGLPSHNAPPLG